METLSTLCQMFDDGVESGTIKMTVDHDCGHAYNGWSGQYLDLLQVMADNLSPEDSVLWEEHTNDRLSEDDPGLYCVPDFINTLIKLDDGRTPGNDGVTSCECQCPDGAFDTVEGGVDYLKGFMTQLEDMDQENTKHNREWFRFDLMEAYIKANQK